MTNYESTVYTVEDEIQDTSAAFSTLPTNTTDPAGDAQADWKIKVMKLWHSTTLPDGQPINVSVEFELGDVRGLQSFLNDQFGRSRMESIPAAPEEPGWGTAANGAATRNPIEAQQAAEPHLPAPPRPGDVVVTQFGDGRTYAKVIIDQSEQAPGWHAADAIPLRQCPVIYDGVQCLKTEGHAGTHDMYQHAPMRGDQTGDGATPPASPVQPGATGEQADVSATAVDDAVAPSLSVAGWAAQQMPDAPQGIGNDGLTAEERNAGLAPMIEPPMIVDSGAAPARKKSNRRKKEEIAYDNALETFRKNPNSQLEYTALTKAAEALRKRFPGAERLVAYDLHVQHQDTGYLTNPDFAANYRGAAQEAAQIEAQQTTPQFAPEPSAEQPTPFVPPIPGTPALPMPAPEQQSPEELQAAAAFPCSHVSGVSGRRCTRPAGHELADPPKPHIYGELPQGQTLPVPDFIPPMPQPQQPGFTVSPVAQGEGFTQATIPPFQIPQPAQPASIPVTNNPVSDQQVLSFQIPPTPEVRGAELQTPAPAAPPWGGQG